MSYMCERFTEKKSEIRMTFSLGLERKVNEGFDVLSCNGCKWLNIWMGTSVDPALIIDCIRIDCIYIMALF